MATKRKRLFIVRLNVDDMNHSVFKLREEDDKKRNEWLQGFLCGINGGTGRDWDSQAKLEGFEVGSNALRDTTERFASRRYRSKKADPYSHPRWQRLRLLVMDRDGFQCARCGDQESPLHVHHLRYVPGAPVWESPIDDLVTLCDKCHDKAPEHKRGVAEAA